MVERTAFAQHLEVHLCPRKRVPKKINKTVAIYVKFAQVVYKVIKVYIQVNKMNSTTLSTRIDEGTAKKLEALSKATKRSKSYLAAEAINKYVEEQSWQIDAIEQGIKEANKGNFSTDKEVKKFFSKWGIHAD